MRVLFIFVHLLHSQATSQEKKAPFLLEKNIGLSGLFKRITLTLKVFKY